MANLFWKVNLFDIKLLQSWVEHSARDRMLENVLPIRLAEVVGTGSSPNVSRIKKRCHKNVIPRLHFRVAGSFLLAAARAF